jgi:DHA2 family multidrug resistance protein
MAEAKLRAVRNDVEASRAEFHQIEAEIGEALERYPVLMIGLLLAPRGIGKMIALIVCGRLVAHMDPRIILALGFVAQGISTWMMAGFSLESGTWEVFWAGVLQGFGVGMMFLPLSLITFETLPVALRTDGSALFHLLRNIGSSIGISLAITFLVRSTQHNRAEFALYASPFNEVPRLYGLDLSSLNDLLALSREIDRQAAMIAYVNDFHIMTLLAFRPAADPARHPPPCGLARSPPGPSELSATSSRTAAPRD